MSSTDGKEMVREEKMREIKIIEHASYNKGEQNLENVSPDMV